jgi:hypothetical protein
MARVMRIEATLGKMITLGGTPLGPNNNSSNLKNFNRNHFRALVTNVVVRNILPRIVNMYKELQQLRSQNRQAYNFENPNPPPDPSPYAEDIENYMTIYDEHSSNPNEALLDTASTHTILTNPAFFNFRGQ